MGKKIVDVIGEEMVLGGLGVEGVKDEKGLKCLWDGMKVKKEIVEGL